MFARLSFFCIALTALWACSFKPKETASLTGDNSGGGRAEEIKELLPEDDGDGDLIKNGEEIQRGTNPLVADVPVLNVHFLQSFTLTAYNDGSGGGSAPFKTEKRLESGDFDFKYRVGHPLIRTKSELEVAKVAGFSSVFQGEMNEFDLSLVEYPRLERGKYLADLLSYQKSGLSLPLDEKYTSLEFENSIELTPAHQFKEVKNVELGFWYFNRATDQYELLGTQVVEREFLPGVKETFSSKLEGLPNRLLVENYLRHGELILTEVRDFEIPELNTSYKKLLESVRAKSLPVIVNDPLGTRINFVGVPEKRNSLGQVLASLFSADVTIQDNLITKIGAYENSTPDYKELKELKDNKKQGRWFVFTNQFKHDLWEHPFNPQDRLVLTYAQDHVIAQEPQEITTNSFRSVSAQSSVRLLPLGNISANSSLRLLVNGIREFGQKIDQFDDVFQSGPCPGGSNVVCRDFRCLYNRHMLTDFDWPINLGKDLSDEILNYMSLRINETIIPLSNLVKREDVMADPQNDSLLITIPDLAEFLKDIPYTKDDVISLEMRPKVYNDFRGIKFVSAGGAHGSFMCGQHFIKPEMQPRDVQYNKFLEIDLAVSMEHYFN